MKNKFLPLIGVVIFLIVWYIISLAHIIKPAFLDPPHRVFKALLRILSTEQIWSDIFATLYRTVLGFSLSVLIGTPVGMLIGYSSTARNTFESLVDFLRSIPATALLPLFIICLGIGDAGKIALVVFASTLIITIYTMLGVKNCSKTRQLFAKTVGASQMDIFRKIVFFEALPSTFAGLRTSISLALVLVIVAEMIMMGGKAGLGGRIYLARYGSDYTEMYALIVICGLIGYGLNKGFQALGNKFIHWVGK